MSASRLPPQAASYAAILRSNLPELRQRYGVEKLSIFGSHVRGEAVTKSDLDVLVNFDDRPMGLIEYLELEYHLSDLLGVRVDLVEREGLKPSIGKRVLREAVEL